MKIHIDLTDQGPKSLFLKLTVKNIGRFTVDRRKNAGMEGSVTEHILCISFINRRGIFRIGKSGFLRKGVDIQPVYYSAGYKDGTEQQTPYNLSKLLYLIIQHTPKKKRLIYAQNVSRDAEVWKDNDERKDYGKEIRSSFVDTVIECASEGADIGGEIGRIFGKAGEVVGRVVGGIVGAVWGAVKSIFSWW